MDLTLSLEYQERDLVDACIRRERWAQQKLYEEHYTRMMSVCLRYASNPDDALDILHEGFIKVFKHIGEKYQPGTSLVAWIRRIMVNTSIDYYRMQMRRRANDLGDAYAIASPDPDAISQCSEQDILEAIRQLSPVYRAVFNLFVIEGYSHREIGEELGITESTSRSNLVKARTKLQEILTPKEKKSTTSK